jgi:acetoin utilization protein AcuB
MIAGDLITDEVPPLKNTDSVDLALNWMEEFKVNHLAVTKGKEYLGIVSEAELLDSNHPDYTIDNLKLNFAKPVIHKDQHVYEAIKLMSKMHLSLLPVLDEKEEFLGSITQRSVLEKMAGITSVQEPGGIIVLQMVATDYNLTQIASIVESNDSKILSVNVTSAPETKEIEVTIKVNNEDLSRILQTFYRYNYNVKASYHQSQFEDDLKNRFDEFMRFINI